MGEKSPEHKKRQKARYRSGAGRNSSVGSMTLPPSLLAQPPTNLSGQPEQQGGVLADRQHFLESMSKEFTPRDVLVARQNYASGSSQKR